MTTIEWTHMPGYKGETLNLAEGCTAVSEGCRNCYAATMARRFSGEGERYEGLARHTPQGDRWTGMVRLRPERLGIPFHWKRPRMVFVNSMSDLFHEDVPDKYIAKVFAIMDLARHHIYQVLTKRPERAAKLLADEDFQFHVGWFQSMAIREFNLPEPEQIGPWPFRNVWIGTSVENQQTADERIGPAEEIAKQGWLTWVSYAPALGWVDWAPWMKFLKWAAAEGESGHRARPSHPDLFRSLRDHCVSAGVPFFFKQWGERVPLGSGCGGPDRYSPYKPNYTPEQLASLPTMERHANGRPFRDVEGPGGFRTMIRVGKKRAGALLDGREWREWPEVAAKGATA